MYMDSIPTDDEDYVLKEYALKQLITEKNFTLGGHALNGLTIEKYNDHLINAVVYNVRTLIPAEDMKTATHTVQVRHPDGWWNAFKDQYFSPWLLKRYPVKYVTKEETVTFTAYNLYPEFPEVYPGCGDGRQIIVKYTK